MTSANEDTPRKLKSKKDPLRFLPPGLYFRGKFIGIEHVADACGDRSDMMCQVAMAKMKAAIKTLGDHKRKIVINISTSGIKILDEKDEDMIFDHPLSRISYISRDISDSRAFGYVFNPGLDCHEFYGIKTEKAADVVVTTLRDLFYNTECNRNNNTSLPEDSSHFYQSWRMPSPPFSLKYGGFSEGGTLGRFKKSPHLLYRFYNTVSNTPLPASPRKQAGFLTLYNRQNNATTVHHPLPNTSPVSSTIRQVDNSSSTAVKTPSLSSSSSSNQNVNNSPSTSAVKSPMSVIASKKSLSSVGSLPVIESPPSSPATFKVQSLESPGSSSRVNADQSVTGSYDRSQNRTPEGDETKLSEEIEISKQAKVAEASPDSNRVNIENITAFEESKEQLSWANFEEFEFSDESPAEGSVDRKIDGGEAFPAKTSEFDSNYRLSEDEQTTSSRSRDRSEGSAFKNSRLVLSFEGIDPFLDDPFFSKDVDISFDGFKIDDDLSEFELITLKEENRDAWTNCSDANDEVFGQARHEETIKDGSSDAVEFQDNFGASGVDEFEDKFFDDNFAPEVEVNFKSNDAETDGSWRTQGASCEEPPCEVAKECPTSESPLKLPSEGLKVEAQCIQVSSETLRIKLPSMNLKPVAVFKPGLAFDSSPTSPSTDPSEFPSPDIPPPPLPPEATSISPLHPTPPPLPPRRPRKSPEADVSIETEAIPQKSRLVGIANESESFKPQKLDTASILKLYSVSATSYFSSKNSGISPCAANVGCDEAAAYGNARSIFAGAQKTDNNNVRSSENLNFPSSELRPPHLVHPGVLERQSSATLPSFHSYSSTERNPQNGQSSDKGSISFSRSLDESI